MLIITITVYFIIVVDRFANPDYGYSSTDDNLVESPPSVRPTYPSGHSSASIAAMSQVSLRTPTASVRPPVSFTTRVSNETNASDQVTLLSATTSSPQHRFFFGRFRPNIVIHII